MVSPHIIKELSFTAQSSHRQLLHISTHWFLPAPLWTLLGFATLGTKPHLDAATSDLWLSAEQENEKCIFKVSFPKYPPFPKYANICLRCFAQLEGEPFLGSVLLISTSCSSRRGEKKKIHNIPHTFLGSLFSLSRIKCCWHVSPRFPDWAWRQNYADSQTHTRFLLHSPALCCQLTAIFFFSKGPSAYKRRLREAVQIHGAFRFGCLESFSPGKRQHLILWAGKGWALQNCCQCIITQLLAAWELRWVQILQLINGFHHAGRCWIL